jgi:hypothetical protein
VHVHACFVLLRNLEIKFNGHVIHRQACCERLGPRRLYIYKRPGCLGSVKAALRAVKNRV